MQVQSQDCEVILGNNCRREEERERKDDASSETRKKETADSLGSHCEDVVLLLQRVSEGKDLGSKSLGELDGDVYIKERARTNVVRRELSRLRRERKLYSRPSPPIPTIPTLDPGPTLFRTIGE